MKYLMLLMLGACATPVYRDNNEDKCKVEPYKPKGNDRRI